MKGILSLLAIIFISMVLVFTTVYNTESATTYALLCRGAQKDFTVASSYLEVRSYTRNTLKAGSQGEYLKPGTCAWQDRALQSGEWHAVHISLPDDRSRYLIPVYTQYLSNPDYTIMFKVYKTKVGGYDVWFHSAGGVVDIYKPTFK